MSLKLKFTKFTQGIKFYYKSVLINSKTILSYIAQSIIFIQLNTNFLYLIPLFADPNVCFASCS